MHPIGVLAIGFDSDEVTATTIAFEACANLVFDAAESSMEFSDFEQKRS